MEADGRLHGWPHVRDFLFQVFEVLQRGGELLLVDLPHRLVVLRGQGVLLDFGRGGGTLGTQAGGRWDDSDKDGKDGSFGQLVGARLLGNHRRLGEVGRPQWGEALK